MCLVVAAVESSAHYSLLFAANRDERHARPTAYASWWQPEGTIFGGRDLVAGGSWLGVDRRGRLAAVTNYREITATAAPRSRGALVAEYLAGSLPSTAFGERLQRDGRDYGPFSLLLFEDATLRYFSNRAPAARLGGGVHALSNAAYGVEWPKVRSARAAMGKLLDAADPLDGLFALLAERSPEASFEARYQAAHFVVGDVYGTRCSTVVLIDRRGNVTFVERSFDSAGRQTHEVRESFAAARGSQSIGRARETR
jgi:uncharacterized protein with NRDE domain